MVDEKLPIILIAPKDNTFKVNVQSNFPTIIRVTMPMGMKRLYM